MAKEYEKKIAVASIDQAPPGDAMTDDFTSVAAWTVEAQGTSADVTTDTTRAYTGSKCMKVKYLSGDLAAYQTFYRQFPFSSQNHINFEFAIGPRNSTTHGDVSFVIGHSSNASAHAYMKFKILAFGTLSSTLQYWRSSDNTWVSFGTLLGNLWTSNGFITISGKFNIATGLFEELRIGAQKFTFVNVGLEGEEAQIFEGGDTFPAINSGNFGIQITQATAATELWFYIDRIRIFGSSV